MNEKIKVLQLAKEKYKTATNSNYGIESIAGTCLVDAFIEIRGYATWGNLSSFLISNFGMKYCKNYTTDLNCQIFLKNFKFEQKTMSNE